MLAVQVRVTECDTAAAPVPESEIMIEGLEALLVMVRLPVTLPVDAGAKITFRVAV